MRVRCTLTSVIITIKSTRTVTDNGPEPHARFVVRESGEQASRDRLRETAASVAGFDVQGREAAVGAQEGPGYHLGRWGFGGRGGGRVRGGGGGGGRGIPHAAVAQLGEGRFRLWDLRPGDCEAELGARVDCGEGVARG